MRTYADPHRCPDCGGELRDLPVACPSCGLALSGQTAARLFATLQQVDLLLAELRRAPTPVPVGAGAPHSPTDPGLGASGSPLPPLPSLGVPGRPTPTRSGVSGASVPRILLSLGALCLLVAAVTFLAVAWEWLGVGGRTLVLVLFTASVGGLTTWLARRALRAAAEALSVVTAGLVTLDLVGAADAGWLDVHGGGLVMAVGLVLGATGIAATAVTRDGHPLWAPQVIGSAGLWAVPAGALDLTSHTAAVMLLGTLGLGAVGTALHVGRVGRTAWFVGAAAAMWWAGLTLTGLARLAEHPEARELWGGLHPWPVLAAAGILAAAAVAVRRWPVPAALTLGGAAGLAALPLVSPALDDSATSAACATLVAAAAFAGATLALPRPWRLAGAAPAAVAALLPVFVGLVTAIEVGATRLDVWPAWTRPASVRPPSVETSAHPLLVPATVLLACLVALASASVGRPAGSAARPLAVPAGGVVLLGGVVALAAYAVPLALVVATLLAVAAVLLVWATPSTSGPALAAHGLALGTLTGAVVVAMPSVVLTLVALLATLACAALVATRAASPAARVVALATVPPAAAGLVWCLAELAGLDLSWRATAALLVLGALALALPRLQVELPAAAAGVVAAAASVVAGFDVSESRGLVVLALDLTVAGAMVTASSLAHPSRRVLAAPGGLLLAMATWVRLWDLGVTAPEAYTLPSAVVLLGLGLWHLRRRAEASTMLALGPGLALATVPTLLRVFVDEAVSARPLLLGVATLGLVLAGVRLRWSAPLLVGALVGSLVVVRELGPYAAALPPWLVIAVAGTALTVVGVTWEARMNDLRRTGRYLDRLR